MIKMIDFQEVEKARGVFYGGDAGAKESIIYDDDIYMIKYPKTTRDMMNPQLSYTTSPLSEYLGSQIYQSFGIPTHETLLGVKRNKVVVACKDFTRKLDVKSGNRSVQIKQLVPFHDLKNSFMSSDLESYSGTGSETLLDEVLATLVGQEDLSSIEGSLERFWDMFVIDAFIGNNDRNNGNWGIVIEHTGEVFLAPVYDNGSAFFNKRSIQQMEKRLSKKELMDEDSFKSVKCVYKYKGLDNEGHTINPFKFMEKRENEDCNQAINRFLERVNLDQMECIIEDIPDAIGSLAVMPSIQKEFYKALLRIRYGKIKNFC